MPLPNPSPGDQILASHIVALKDALVALDKLTTQGDLLYRDGSGYQRLPKGSALQVLRQNAGLTAPEWATMAGGIGYVAQASLAGAATSLTISGLAAYELLEVYIFVPSNSAGALNDLTFNADSGANYSWALTVNGAAAGTGGNYNYIFLDTGAGSTNMKWYKLTIYNLAAYDKTVLFKGGTLSNTDADEARNIDGVGAWNNSTDAISSIKIHADTGNLAIGTKIIVYGHNPT